MFDPDSIIGQCDPGWGDATEFGFEIGDDCRTKVIKTRGIDQDQGGSTETTSSHSCAVYPGSRESASRVDDSV